MQTQEQTQAQKAYADYLALETDWFRSATVEVKVPQKETKAVPAEDQGTYSLSEYKIRGRSRVRLVIEHDGKTRQFWISSTPAPMVTQRVTRTSTYSEWGGTHFGECQLGCRYGQSGIGRSTRSESCDCDGEPELLAYWKATPGTIQQIWDRYHASWSHVHGYDYSGLGQYGGRTMSELAEGKTAEMSDGEDDEPETDEATAEATTEATTATATTEATATTAAV